MSIGIMKFISYFKIAAGGVKNEIQREIGSASQVGGKDAGASRKNHRRNLQDLSKL
jgi:hypothetical protein